MLNCKNIADIKDILEIILAMSKETKMKVLPWLLIFGGFGLLNLLPPVVAGGCIVVGITMLLNRIWPEEWEEEKAKV